MYFEFLLYLNYINRCIQEQLSDIFSAGGNYLGIKRAMEFYSLELLIYSDKVQQTLEIVRDLISNQADFNKEMEKRFEIYRDSVLQGLSINGYLHVLNKYDLILVEAITKDENDNLPPIYNYYNFPIDSFSNINYKNLSFEITNSFYSIKYIYLFGYLNKTETVNIYELFKSTNNFNLSLDNANFNDTNINEANFINWTFDKNLIKKTLIFGAKIVMIILAI